MARPSLGEPDDLVARAECVDPRSGFGDDAGEIASLAGRERRREYVLHDPLADGRLAGVDSRGLDLDENLAGPGLGSLDVTDIEHVYVAILIESHCLAHNSYERHCACAIPPG